MTQNYTTSITVDQSPDDVFAAVSNPRGWWSADIEGGTMQPGDVWYYQARDLHRCTLKVLESTPGRKVAWQVLDNNFSFTEDKSEWIGSTLVFDIDRVDDRTRLTFTHVGLVPDDECYEVCHDAWRTYIRGSLKSLLTTGKGHPNTGATITAEQAAAAAKHFTTSLVVAAPPATVFAAVTDPRGWWSGDIEGNTRRLGDVFTYRYKDMHYSKQKLVEVEQDKRVAWRVMEGTLNFVDDKSEWVGTTIRFDIAPKGDKTELVFTHVGLQPAVECYDTCTDAWTSLIQGSLRQLIEEGRADKPEL